MKNGLSLALAATAVLAGVGLARQRGSFARDESFYVEKDDDTGNWCVFGDVTGKAYDSFSNKPQAEKACDERNETTIGNRGRQGSRSKRFAQDVAKDPSSALADLSRLSKSWSPEVRKSVAQNAAASAAILVTLAKDDDERVRSAVARNASAPLSALAVLAEDKSARVRGDVARNASTPTTILTELMKTEVERGLKPTWLGPDDDAHVRSVVAKRLASPEILAKLSRSQEGGVRLAVANNRFTPPSSLARLANERQVDGGGRPGESVWMAVAGNPSTPVDTLMSLATRRHDAWHRMFELSEAVERNLVQRGLKSAVDRVVADRAASRPPYRLMDYPVSLV